MLIFRTYQIHHLYFHVITYAIFAGLCLLDNFIKEKYLYESIPFFYPLIFDSFWIIIDFNALLYPGHLNHIDTLSLWWQHQCQQKNINVNLLTLLHGFSVRTSQLHIKINTNYTLIINLRKRLIIILIILIFLYKDRE